MATGPMKITTYESLARSLFLYRCVLKADIRHFDEAGALAAKTQGHDATYIGLRENPEDALDRTKLYNDRVGKDIHCLLEEFTPQGIAHFVMQCQGPEHQFQSTLFKVTYRGSKDWDVWHFLGDLPLQAVGGMNNPLIISRWMEIQ